MDEEEKPFPIEYFSILLLVAIANDIAEIFFDLLDLTGVGLAGEAIMEPVDFILDLFFTGMFFWKVGFGGSTITQYIGDLLEPLFIPGRTISVFLGMYTANNPSSFLGKMFTQASSIESGNVKGALGDAKNAAGTVEKEAGGAKKGIQGETTEANKENAAGGASATDQKPSLVQEKDAQGKDVFKNPLENPVGTAGEEEFNPREDTIQEGGEDMQKAA